MIFEVHNNREFDEAFEKIQAGDKIIIRTSDATDYKFKFSGWRTMDKLTE